MDSKPTIVVLEDDNWRITQMRRVARDTLSSFDCVFFDNAAELQSWLSTHLSCARLISLDCDLDSTAVATESDVGSGSDVVEYLAGLPSSCPVVVHSSNAMRAPAMHMALTFAGWSVVKLSPFTDAESWVVDVINAINESEQ